jgi:hypothetical protein
VPADNSVPADPKAGEGGIRIFAKHQTSLVVDRDDDDAFELVVRVHGEEVTTYDLDRDNLATIGRRLMALAMRA